MKKKILITNDDGYSAPGIQALRKSLMNEYDVMVVAPKTQKSGAGCGFTVHHDFEVIELEENGKVWGYAVDGTPVDCVKFADGVLKDFKADLVLSGINDGGNFGKSFWYSGTIAGAVEATLIGYRAVAISMWNNKSPERPFDDVAALVKPLIPWFMEQIQVKDTFWNINLPNTPGKDIKGYRLTKMGQAFYKSTFLEPVERDGKKFYSYAGGQFVREEEDIESDDHALALGFGSISLMNLDPSFRIPFNISETFELEINQLVGKEEIKRDKFTS